MLVLMLFAACPSPTPRADTAVSSADLSAMVDQAACMGDAGGTAAADGCADGVD